MEDSFSEEQLDKIFWVEEGRIRRYESSWLEFKQSFHPNSMYEYTKTMAAKEKTPVEAQTKPSY